MIIATEERQNDSLTYLIIDNINIISHNIQPLINTDKYTRDFTRSSYALTRETLIPKASGAGEPNI